MKSSRVSIAGALSAIALLIAGCGGSSSASTTTKSTSAPATSTQSSPSSSAASSSSSSSALPGTWSGQYSGTFSGTFKLTWKQTGSKLSGVIHLTPGGTYPINGTVTGGSIKFGTVGGPGITYSGSVSGSSMSGNYQTPKGGGSWSANKS